MRLNCRGHIRCRNVGGILRYTKIYVILRFIFFHGVALAARVGRHHLTDQPGTFESGHMRSRLEFDVETQVTSEKNTQLICQVVLVGLELLTHVARDETERVCGRPDDSSTLFRPIFVSLVRTEFLFSGSVYLSSKG